MRRQPALWGVFVSRFEDALSRFRRRSIGDEEAGELLTQARSAQPHRSTINNQTGLILSGGYLHASPTDFALDATAHGHPGAVLTYPD